MRYFYKRAMVLVIFTLISLIGCGLSKVEIQDQVKYLFQDKISNDEYFNKYNLQVNEIILVNIGKNSYDGIAKVIFEDNIYDVPLTVNVDGETIMFQTKPMAFMFLAQHELKKMGF